MAKRTNSTTTRPVPTAARPTTSSPVACMPDEDAIRRRAYEIYMSRGAKAGTPLEDWLQAERELSGRRRIASTAN